MRFVLSRTRELVEGEILPWGYGVAWRDYSRDVLVAYPVGLNLLLRFGRAFYFWIANPNWAETWIEKKEKQAYESGFRQGKLTGEAMEKTRQEGRMEAAVELLIRMNTMAAGRRE